MEIEIDASTSSTPEQRLISSVIGMALRDACLPPLKPHNKKHFTLTFNAMTAHDFLWTEALDSYLHYLDIDADYFRNSLIKTMSNDNGVKIGAFKPDDRRAFRFNKKLWDSQQSSGLVKPLADPQSPDWLSVDPSFEQKVRRSARHFAKPDNASKANEPISQTPEGN